MLQDFAQAIIPANASAELGGVTDALRSPLLHADGVLDGLERLGHLHPLMMAAE